MTERDFWASAQRTPSGCLIWLAAVDGHGYGALRYAGRLVKAHRLAYELAVGPIPDGRYVCHSCDQPACIEPDHLYAGTAAMNSADMSRRDRAVVGERSQNAKLTENDVRAIRARYQAGERAADLAPEFGVRVRTLYNVLEGRTWRHVA